LGELRQSSLAIGRQRCLVALEAAELTAVTVFHASAIGIEILAAAAKDHQFLAGRDDAIMVGDVSGASAAAGCFAGALEFGSSAAADAFAFA